MKRALLLATVALIGMTTLFTGCGGATDKKADDKLTIVWYPNESGGDLEEARNEIGKVVEEATGKKVEHKLTTDYSIAIEAISNNTADLAFMGAQGYVEAHKKNDKVLPLVVSSGKSGTLDDAVYYSWLSVPKEKESEYKDGEKYDISKIEGKKMSFVSNSSTSGFKIPTSTIVSKFSKEDKWKNLKAEDLMQGGSNKFFSEVMFGGSHQGAAVNILNGKSDVAAFCDTVLVNYIDTVNGEFNATGTSYKIKSDAAEPFNNLTGKEFTVICSTPVLNTPFAMNTKTLSEEDQKKLVEKFTSDEVTNNKKIFVQKDSGNKGFFTKEGKEKFLKVDDKWFDPVRELSK